MRKRLKTLILTLLVMTFSGGVSYGEELNKANEDKETKETKETKDFYNLKAQALLGEDIEMDRYRGKVILIVNTASKCGLTPQYEGLELLYKRYKDQGLVILGFPCNQFGNQEPGDSKSISEGCLINYGVTFPMFSKIEVNGDNTDPIFKFLKSKLEGDVKWNFTKFLVDRDGTPIKRFSPKTKPEELVKDIEMVIDN